MHLCPDCQEYCGCHHDTDVPMQAAPADCAHDCNAPPRQPWVRTWPWEKPEADVEREPW